MNNARIKGKILVIDDDPDISQIIKEELRSDNFCVKAVHHYQKALELCKNESFDISLVDHNLINCTGMELIKKLQKIAPAMEYIIITGHASLDNALEAFQHKNVLYYEAKPINFDRLLSFLNQRMERLKIAKTLRKNEQKFRQIYNNVNDAIYLYEVNNTIPGRFLEVNELACQMLDYERKELLKMTYTDIDKSINKEEIKTIMENLHQNRDQTYETTHITRNGKQVPVEVSSHLFQLDDEKVVLSVARDITYRRQSEKEKEKLYEQLLQTQKLESIGQLAGGVAHDFNNILTVISCQAEMLGMNMERENPNYSGIEIINESVERAKKLTQQLLLFSRNEPSLFKSLNLNNIINQLIKMISRLIGENIEIEMKLEDDLWNVLADEGQLEQIIINLVINARDAMPEGGKLVIITENAEVPRIGENKHFNSNNKCVRLMIEDNGKGIDSEIRDKIFDPFFTTKEKTKGTGMGLSVVYGIIRKHNGAVGVESKLDRGSRFIIELPACTAENPRSEMGNANRSGLMQGEGENILVVEDEPHLVTSVREMLERNNYNVDTAFDGNQAINMIGEKENYYDLVISDVLLPDINGVGLLEKINKHRKNLPIIFCSGYTDERSKQDIIVKKGIPFLQKPYKINTLLRKVKEALKN